MSGEGRNQQQASTERAKALPKACRRPGIAPRSFRITRACKSKGRVTRLGSFNKDASKLRQAFTKDASHLLAQDLRQRCSRPRVHCAAFEAGV